MEICQQIQSNQTTVGKVASEYGIARPIVSRWIAEYLRYGNEAFSGKLITFKTSDFPIW